MSIFSQNPRDTIYVSGHPVRCSICSSAPNRQGLECIENPQKFSRDCNTGPRKNDSYYKEYKGCWKIEQFVLYDGPEPFNIINKNTSGLENKPRDDDKSIECEKKGNHSSSRIILHKLFSSISNSFSCSNIIIV